MKRLTSRYFFLVTILKTLLLCLHLFAVCFICFHYLTTNMSNNGAPLTKGMKQLMLAKQIPNKVESTAMLRKRKQMEEELMIKNARVYKEHQAELKSQSI